MLIQRGFTIVELLIVIVVIAILAAISVVMYSNLQARTLDTHRTSTVTNIQKYWSDVKVDNPTASQYRFAYITHTNTNGSGFNCDSTQRCQSYDLTYISNDGEPHRLTNNGNLRGN